MSEVSVNEVSINGEVYIKKSLANTQTPALDLNGMKCCIVRTYSAGVFIGYVKRRDGKEVVLVNARRLWRWSGAASLSELAVNGTSNPSGCKFPCVVPEITLTESIEIIPCSEKSVKSICDVPVWSVQNEQ